VGTADGSLLGTTQILDNGSPAQRYNLVLISEGYQRAQLAQFASDAQSFVNTLFATPPFSSMRCAFNIYRVDVASTDSGADDPTPCGGTGATPRTYFDASFCNGGIRRLLECDTASVRNVVNAQVPQWHQILVLVNSPVYGGSGGAIATFAVNGNWQQVALHEIGHASFGFADEYEYWAGCGVDAPGTHDHHAASEPAQPNVTINTDRATLKWASLVGASTTLPTMPNPDCTQCNRGASPVPAGTVGLFEGADYYHCGAYRGEYECRMRDIGPEFCAVCQQVIRKTMDPFMNRQLGPWVGVQFTGSVAPMSTQRWFTFNWPAVWQVVWMIVPTSPRPGAPQVSWRVQAERASSEFVTYWISITNLTSTAVTIEARYGVLSGYGTC
jgi:hypothetical protein